jgi:hypothetical protein
MTSELKVRLGHAILEDGATKDGALNFALELIEGTVHLAPRPPRDIKAVGSAESIMKLKQRPIYAYLGLLHPELGTVGVIIVPGWISRCALGVSRCDSGGLADGKGGFVCVKDRAASLLALYFNDERLALWESEFSEELSNSYKDAEVDYVHGVTPNYGAWKDARAESIQYLVDGGVELDRRLWTWEAQLVGSPSPHDIECLVLSPEMHKRLEVMRREGRSIPSSVRILPGAVSSSGVHWFDSEPVKAAFLGQSL